MPLRQVKKTAIAPGPNARFGWIPDTPDPRDHYYSTPVTMSALPRKFSRRDGFGPVVDQGQLGSCTGNGIAQVLRYNRIRQDLDNWLPSRLFIYYLERKALHTIAEDSGASIRSGIKAVHRHGAPHEDLWPYDISKFVLKPPQAAYDDAKLHPAVSYSRVTQSLYAMRHCLAKYGPIVIGFTVFESFEDAPLGRVPMPDISREEILGGHCVVLTGYDDDLQTFGFMNSWGEAWGDSGYGTFPYNYMLNSDYADDFWTIKLVT